MSDSSASTSAASSAAAPPALRHASEDRAFFGHPRGLGLIFGCEMWERFSYYGMRAILVLYLVNYLRWDTARAASLYGTYTMAVYLTPLVGGYLADRWIGTRRSLFIGGLVIAAGHFALAFPGMKSFYVGLALIVIGTGFFKPCVSVMVGQLYGEADPRRDSGFTIFYMGINVGAFLSGVVAGTLGETVGWHWGFGSAGVGMVLGLFVYQYLRPKYLQGIGLAPKEAAEFHRESEPEELACKKCKLVLGELPEGVACPDCGSKERAWFKASELIGRKLSKVNWHRIGVILVLAVFVIFFWAAFEQAGSSMNVFAKDNTDRMVGSYEFPATWYQSVNPAVIVLFAPIFAWLWTWLDKRGWHPRTPTKFSMGLILLGLGFGFMVIAGLKVADGSKAGPVWLLLAYTLHTCGELCLSPVGLSMVTKLAPMKARSAMMGLWFGSNAISNLTAGLLFAYSSRIEEGDVFQWLGGKADFYLVLMVAPITAGLIVLALSPILKRMMHGLH